MADVRDETHLFSKLVLWSAVVFKGMAAVQARQLASELWPLIAVTVLLGWAIVGFVQQ